jgi:hypothetical protein
MATQAPQGITCPSLPRRPTASQGYPIPGSLDELADNVLTGCRGMNMTEVQSEWRGPTVRRMLVGAQLRRLRTDMGLSREEAAQAIRASEWKIQTSS